ncbi:MAG TPA: hypothetical protein VJ397_00350 [Thermoplasmata archaeon]|nr:hypothetical protein [Thermoplasmata archaeon]
MPKPITPPMRRRRGVGSVGENVKKEMFRRVLALAEDPDLLVPECACGRFLCPWDSLRKKLAAVARHRDDARRLESLSKGGKPLPRALAASLHFAKTGEIKGMAPFKVRNRTYYWAPRAGVPQKALLGVQNTHIPALRLLALSLVRGRSRYVVYSLRGRAVARRPDEPVPKELVDELAEGLKYALRRDEGGWECGHVAEAAHLAVEHKRGGFSVRVCSRCARDEENVAIHIGERILAAPGARPLRFVFHPQLACLTEECSIPPSWEVNPQKEEAYAHGELSDRWVITKELARLENKIEGRGVYAIPGKCFEQDGEAFLAALEGTEAEKRALAAVLGSMGGIQLAEASTAKLLEAVWPKHAKRAVAAIVGEEDADRLLGEMPKASPQQVVAAAEASKRKDALLTSLPKLASLPPLASLVDRTMRLQRTGDFDGATRLLEAEAKDHRGKAVRYGFLLLFGKAKAAEWQFNRMEKELGTFLQEPLAALVKASGDAYRGKLQELLTLSGSAESLPEQPA